MIKCISLEANISITLNKLCYIFTCDFINFVLFDCPYESYSSVKYFIKNFLSCSAILFTNLLW